MPTGHYCDPEYIRNRKKLVYSTWAHKKPCWLCGLPFRSKGDITADHVIPIFKGGTHEYSNLRPAHGKCNNERNHELEDEPEELPGASSLLLGLRHRTSGRPVQCYTLS